MNGLFMGGVCVVTKYGKIGKETDKIGCGGYLVALAGRWCIC
jgi:hypothetical protein